jgi:hypothetical protein
MDPTRSIDRTRVQYQVHGMNWSNTAGVTRFTVPETGQTYFIAHAPPGLDDASLLRIAEALTVARR